MRPASAVTRQFAEQVQIPVTLRLSSAVQRSDFAVQVADLLNVPINDTIKGVDSILSLSKRFPDVSKQQLTVLQKQIDDLRQYILVQKQQLQELSFQKTMSRPKPQKPQRIQSAPPKPTPLPSQQKKAIQNQLSTFFGSIDERLNNESIQRLKRLHIDQKLDPRSFEFCSQLLEELILVKTDSYLFQKEQICQIKKTQNVNNQKYEFVKEQNQQQQMIKTQFQQKLNEMQTETNQTNADLKNKRQYLQNTFGSKIMLLNTKTNIYKKYKPIIKSENINTYVTLIKENTQMIMSQNETNAENVKNKKERLKLLENELQDIKAQKEIKKARAAAFGEQLDVFMQ
ncbi:Hypothetical_protein [Hexamita inflata]|uniref:Hypothetical_protein n=1 Tax=Hexamita inflata TaxID=28002 RepID=A0AA86UXV1_9EUKA|nr:Hypothetical protein HINF_LOCUS40023 [Hexamita inflata]